MYTYIGIECLAANALIQLCQETDIRRISFRQLTDFSLKVVDKYEDESGKKAVFIFDKNAVQGLIMDYSEYFEIAEEGVQKYICLKDGVNLYKLKEHFRWTLSYAMLRALTQVNVVDMIAN